MSRRQFSALYFRIPNDNEQTGLWARTAVPTVNEQQRLIRLTVWQLGWYAKRRSILWWAIWHHATFRPAFTASLQSPQQQYRHVTTFSQWEQR